MSSQLKNTSQVNKAYLDRFRVVCPARGSKAKFVVMYPTSEKYGKTVFFDTKEEAEEISRKKSESLKGKSSWAKGLTAENDERIAARGNATSIGRKRAFAEGKLIAWNKGETAESDERIAVAARAQKELFLNGSIAPWSKGLSKESDERIAKMSEKVSLSLRQKNIRNHLDALKRLPENTIKERIEDRGMLRVIGGLENYINDAQKVIQVQCLKCKESFYGSLRSLQYGKCFKCSPGGSIAQENLTNWIKELGLEVIKNSRALDTGRLELDIYIESKKVAIEYNGLYWHSHTGRSSTYHSNKTTAAIKKGITLIHVFEDEWRDKNEIIKDCINNKVDVLIMQILCGSVGLNLQMFNKMNNKIKIIK